MKKIIMSLIALFILSISFPVYAATPQTKEQVNTITLEENIPTYDYYEFKVISVSESHIIATPENSDIQITFPMDYMREGDHVQKGNSLGVVIDPTLKDSDNSMGLINIEEYRP